MAALTIIRFLFRLKDVDPTAIADGRVLVARVDGSQPSGFIHQYEAQGGGGGGAPTNVDYLVGTADATLTNEIVVGVSPGGELGGTWASPTVDAVHSGSSHAQTQAAAEATAAAALAAHVLTDVMDGDAAGGVLSGTYPNPGFAVDMATQAELDAHINDPTGAHAGTAIGNTPAGGIAATTVQAAINELDTEKANVANAVMDGDAAGGVLSGTYPNPGFAVDMATQAELDGHVNDATAAHAASAVSADSTSLSGTGTDVQAVLEELDNLLDDHSARHENGGADEISIAGLDGTPTELTNHLNDATAAHAASAISVDSTTLVGTGTDVQAVFEELDNGIADHLADATAAHAASAIANTAAGNIVATDVQAAINELDTEKTTAAAALSAAQTEIADQKRVIEVLVTDPNGSSITTGDGKAYFVIPALMNGHNLVAVLGAVTGQSSSGSITIQFHNVTQAADMLSGLLTINASTSFSTTATIDTGNDDVATGDIIRVDVDSAGTSAEGLIVALTFEAP